MVCWRSKSAIPLIYLPGTNLKNPSDPTVLQVYDVCVTFVMAFAPLEKALFARVWRSPLYGYLGRKSWAMPEEESKALSKMFAHFSDPKKMRCSRVSGRPESLNTSVATFREPLMISSKSTWLKIFQQTNQWSAHWQVVLFVRELKK